MLIDKQEQFRKAKLAGALEAVCQQLELTESQYELARGRYEGVGRWLAESDHPALHDLQIYVQGSTAIGTTVKPIGRSEHDVDLIAHMKDPARAYAPAAVKKLIGDRLKEHGKYRPLVEEMCRCWRLDYANEFHLDITPSIPNADCANGGELVPDKDLKDWKASNPKGYKDLFDERAALQPQFRMRKDAFSFGEGAASASVEPYPEAGGFKGLLRRTVQIAKRHRDVHFESRPAGLAPISVIVTTLLSRSYEACVRGTIYDNEFDLMLDVVRHMPDTIERFADRWFIWNETTAGENFAEKWNRHPERATAFSQWHAKLSSDLSRLNSLQGLDQIAKGIGESFGETYASAAMAHLTDGVSVPRATGKLAYAPRVGLGLAAAASAVPVRANTFFGR